MAALILGEVVKHTYDVAPLSIDWTAYVPTGSTISTSTWETDGAMTLGSAAASGLTTSVRISGGAADTYETVTNKVDLASGIKLARSYVVLIREP